MAPVSYLDAGSGSMLLHIVLGGVAAIGVTAKRPWRRVLRTLRIRRDDDDVTESQHSGAGLLSRSRGEGGVLADGRGVARALAARPRGLGRARADTVLPPRARRRAARADPRARARATA